MSLPRQLWLRMESGTDRVGGRVVSGRWCSLDCSVYTSIRPAPVFPGRDSGLPLLEVGDALDAPLCICDHFGEEKGEARPAELSISSAIEVPVIYRALRGYVAR